MATDLREVLTTWILENLRERMVPLARCGSSMRQGYSNSPTASQARGSDEELQRRICMPV